VRLLNRGARKPTPAEVASNPRAESARLRAGEKLDSTEAAG
jgi:16S rRNA C1402 N4-methylase RsmH